MWDTVLPTFGDDLQPAPSPGKANGVAAEQPASSPVQTNPPTPIGSATPVASAASATQDLTLPPAAASPSPSPAETRVETTPVQEGGTDATPRPVVLEQDGGAATPDKVPEGGSELRPKARGRHDHKPRPQPSPTFWQRLFGHNETQPGKPRP